MSSGLLQRLRHPHTTVRWRLTLLYGGLFLASGAALLGVTYTLVAHATIARNAYGRLAAIPGAGASQSVFPPPGSLTKFNTVTHTTAHTSRVPPTVPRVIQKLLKTKPGRNAILIVGSQQRIADLHQLEEESLIALGIMAVICAALGWVVAGRVLSPLRTMTAATRQISAANLNQRLAMNGPRDELRQLADTIDGLLGRLEWAFDAQRRFVANASHELRTPLTAARAMLELVLSDPHATIQTFRTTCRQVLEEGEQQEQLIDALLALAQGQRGLDRTEPIDLASVAGNVLSGYEAEAAARGLALDASLESVVISGDRRLIERLVSNLVENALRHNRPDGRVDVRVASDRGDAVLDVTNTGLPVPADEVDRLLQPFQRLAPERLNNRDGLGLGLSIVVAIASAHEAALDVVPGANGGLNVAVRFPASNVALQTGTDVPASPLSLTRP